MQNEDAAPDRANITQGAAAHFGGADGAPVIRAEFAGKRSDVALAKPAHQWLAVIKTRKAEEGHEPCTGLRGCGGERAFHRLKAAPDFALRIGKTEVAEIVRVRPCMR